MRLTPYFILPPRPLVIIVHEARMACSQGLEQHTCATSRCACGSCSFLCVCTSFNICSHIVLRWYMLTAISTSPPAHVPAKSSETTSAVLQQAPGQGCSISLQGWNSGLAYEEAASELTAPVASHSSWLPSHLLHKPSLHLATACWLHSYGHACCRIHAAPSQTSSREQSSALHPSCLCNSLQTIHYHQV